MTAVVLPWPDPRLSPNAREDRRAISGVRKAQKDTAFWLAKKAGLSFPHLSEGLHVRVTFNPPDRRKRDLDNMLASIKSALDGIALATCVDDSLWGLTLVRGDPVPGGSVTVECGCAGQFIAYRGQIS
jgi:crossover junction endodeoxyribonuclease RusA